MSVRTLPMLLRLCVLLCMLPVVAEALEVSATAAVLMDADTGHILYDKAGTRQMRIASTTKIMTALVALEQGRDSLGGAAAGGDGELPVRGVQFGK